MRPRSVAGPVLTALLCLVLAGCITLTDPRVEPEEEAGLQTLTLQPEGPGTIRVNGMGYNCASACTVPVEAGSMVMLEAVPTADQPFAGWQGANCSGAGSCSINVNGDMTVKAVFANYFLNINVDGGGAVHVTPPGIDCSGKCIIRFDSPEEVKVEKKTEETEIKDWGGICEDAVNSICVVNIDGKTEVEVETETEITQTPPAEEPPAEEPPAEDPPAEEPPAEDPPAEEPPAEDPPAEDPPTEDPPPEDPPAEDPPAEDPPAEDPPVEDPATEDPPTEDPPTEDPATEDPPTEDPTTTESPPAGSAT